MSLSLESPAFGKGERIPVAHTCDGADVSPPLRWSGLPEGTECLALVADDPDAPAGTWVHWVIYGIPAAREGLPEGVPGELEVLDGGRQGTNDFGDPGYGGPCPPPNGAHRYFFKLYALDADPGLEPGATKAELLEAMDGHVLAEADLIGRYRRER